MVCDVRKQHSAVSKLGVCLMRTFLSLYMGLLRRSPKAPTGDSFMRKCDGGGTVVPLEETTRVGWLESKQEVAYL